VTGQTTSTAQLSVTFHWNPDLRWADGTPVTAGDSVFGWEGARRGPSTPEAHAILDMIQRYEMVDAHTTRAVLMPGFVSPTYMLAAWPPLPRHLLQDATSEARERFLHAPLGYGPYTFAAAHPGVDIVLQRNRFWSRQDIPDEVRFHFFPTAAELRAAVNRGEVDVAAIERIPNELYRFLDSDAHNGLSTVTWLRGPVYEHLDFNLAEPLLQDVRIRRAIAYAVNRPAIINDLFGGKATVLHSWIFRRRTAHALCV
jgi:peptide/nickel transport system substrate-binding protein